MIIGVDAGVLGNLDGIQSGNYWLTFNLLKTMGRIDRKNQYRLYSFDPIKAGMMVNFPNNFKNIVIKPKKYWMQLRLSMELLLNPVDVFLGLNQALPLFTKCKSVVFCLDLAFEKLPEYFNNAKKLSWQTKSAVKKADKVIAISNSTAKDLEKFYKVRYDRIKVMPLAVSKIIDCFVSRFATSSQ